MKSKYLILISIGPVQDFIASARKLRDLWFGSYFLSELSKAVALALVKNGAYPIFPCTSEKASKQENDKEKIRQRLLQDLAPGSALTVANKIMVELPQDIDPSKVIANAKEAWTQRRDKFAESAKAKIENLPAISIIEDQAGIFEKQVEDFGEFHAAWTLIEESSDETSEYDKAKKRVEELLAARKKLRDFEKPSWDGTGIIKNSLDGARERVIISDEEEIRGLLKKNEKLDALGCIKRFASLAETEVREKRPFDDLSQVALLPYIKGCKALGKTDLLTDFLKTFLSDNAQSSEKDTKWDNLEDLRQNKLFRDNYDYFFSEESELKEKGAWKSYQKMLKKCGKPPTYAAILVGDGDNMGKLIKQIPSADGHRIITDYLSQFAEEVESCITEDDYGGCLIYAGGDDVMAYIPLHTLLECADKIQKLFKDIMEKAIDKLKLNLQLEKVEVPTFSIGAAIVHHAAPLDRALEMAREAEQAAKAMQGKPDKNSFSICLVKRSGSPIRITDKWEDNTKADSSFVNRLQTMCNHYNEGTLPGTLAFQLRQISKELGENESKEGLLKITISGAGADSESKAVPENAASALVLSVLKQKVHTEDLGRLLADYRYIRKAADELVLTQQLARALKMSRGEVIND
jgi:CRISPR-associated protein Cmr2